MTESRSPLCSVIIANYDGAHMLPTCLDALALQTYSPFEIIVVDDASSDGSVRLLERAYPSIRLLRHAQNEGFIVACRAGARAAQGEILVMLNNDTEPEPGWLEALVSTLATNPDAGSAASKMLLFDQRDRLHTAGDLFGKDGIARNRGVWQRDEGQYDHDLQVFSACGGAAAYTREAWEKTGGFDPGFHMYLEDIDLGWRLQLSGYRCVFSPEARVFHHLSATGGGVTASYYTGRNTIWVVAKNMPTHLLRRYCRRIVGAQLRIAWEALRAWRGDAARARLRGQLAGVAGLPRILRERRRVQASALVDSALVDALLVD